MRKYGNREKKKKKKKKESKLSFGDHDGPYLSTGSTEEQGSNVFEFVSMILIQFLCYVQCFFIDTRRPIIRFPLMTNLTVI